MDKHQQNNPLKDTLTPLWTSTEIAQAVDGKLVGEPFVVNGINQDSRILAQGDLFVALKEGRNDGHDYIAQALKQGAAASMSSQAAAEPYILVTDTQLALDKLAIGSRLRSTKTRRVAVTGSVGKTCVTQAIATVLRSFADTHCPVASFNNHIGVPLTLVRMPKDMPFGVFELGMNAPGEISHLTQLVKPHVAVITKIGNAHSANFEQGIEGIAKAKAEIFEGLEPDGHAVINRDCQWFDLLAQSAKNQQAKVLTFSVNPEHSADAQLLSYREQGGSAEVKVKLLGQEYQFTLAQSSKHWAENCLAILLVAQLMGLALEKAIETLSQITALDGRGAIGKLNVDGAAVTLIDDSYNANPDSMKAAFEQLKTYQSAGRRLAVLTDMLEQSDAAKQHAQLAGRLVDCGIDKVFLAGPQMKHLFAALPRSMAGAWCESVEELLPKLQQQLGNDDVVLVKGSHGSGAWKVVDALNKHLAKA